MADPKKTTGAGDPPKSTPPTGQSDAEAALAALAEAERLAEENAALRADIDAQRRRFDVAWKEREGRFEEHLRAIASEGRLPDGSPVAGRVIGRRVRVAANLIHCHGKNGEKLTLRVGDPIPDDATGIPAGAIVEKEV